MINAREYTCICCPNSCTIHAESDDSGNILISGNQCRKGKEYVLQELTNPLRTVTTTIPVDDGDLPLCSVKLTEAIPKSAIMDVIKEIRKHRITAPVHSGQVVIHNVCGYNSDVVATKNIERVL